MGRLLLGIAASGYLLLGTLHGAWALRDVFDPRSFTPTDEAVRRAMQTARLALNPRATIWQAWLGFNLSHGLGVVLFGGGLLAFACRYFAFFAASALVQGVAVAVAAAYVVLAVTCWYWAPALGAAIALRCILGAVVLS